MSAVAVRGPDVRRVMEAMTAPAAAIRPAPRNAAENPAVNSVGFPIWLAPRVAATAVMEARPMAEPIW